jgi:hypothetical protein
MTAVIVLMPSAVAISAQGVKLPGSVSQGTAAASAAANTAKSIDVSSFNKALGSLNTASDSFEKSLAPALKTAGIDASKASSILKATSGLGKDVDGLLTAAKGAKDLAGLQGDVSKMLGDVRNVDGLLKGASGLGSLTGSWSNVKNSASALGKLFGLKL